MNITSTAPSTARGSVERRRGTALVPTLVVVSSLSIFALAMVVATLSGTRTVNHQYDEYSLSSAVESAAVLAVEKVWSGYLSSQGGAANDIFTFRTYLDGLGIQDAGPGGPPTPLEGTDLTEFTALPLDAGAWRNSTT